MNCSERPRRTCSSDARRRLFTERSSLERLADPSRKLLAGATIVAVWVVGADDQEVAAVIDQHVELIRVAADVIGPILQTGHCFELLPRLLESRLVLLEGESIGAFPRARFGPRQHDRGRNGRGELIHRRRVFCFVRAPIAISFRMEMLSSLACCHDVTPFERRRAFWIKVHTRTRTTQESGWG